MQIAIHSKHELVQGISWITVVEMESQFFLLEKFFFFFFFLHPLEESFSVNSIRMFVNTASLKRAMFWGSPGSGLRAESGSYE